MVHHWKMEHAGGRQLSLIVVGCWLAMACRSEEPIRCGEGTVLLGKECVVKRMEPRMPAADAAAMTSQTPPPDDQLSGSAVAFDKPVVIDGVEIVLGRPTFGSLPKKKRSPYSLGEIPDGSFLQFQAKLRNVSETKIVVLQEFWNGTTLLDEYGNRMAPVGSGLSVNPAIDDLLPSGHLRPGQTAEGLLIFEPPIDAAKAFKIECDPGIFVPVDNMMVRQISDTSFDLPFDRSAIVAKASP